MGCHRQWLSCDHKKHSVAKWILNALDKDHQLFMWMFLFLLLFFILHFESMRSIVWQWLLRLPWIPNDYYLSKERTMNYWNNKTKKKTRNSTELNTQQIALQCNNYKCSFIPMANETSWIFHFISFYLPSLSATFVAIGNRQSGHIQAYNAADIAHRNAMIGEHENNK